MKSRRAVQPGGTIWGAVCPYKPGRHGHLTTTWRGGNTFKRTPARSERSQLLWTKPVRSCFTTLDLYIILWSPIFFRRQYFVDVNILSTPIFCLRLYLLTHIFLEHTVYLLNLLLIIVFCKCHDYYYFV